MSTVGGHILRAFRQFCQRRNHDYASIRGSRAMSMPQLHRVIFMPLLQLLAERYIRLQLQNGRHSSGECRNLRYLCAWLLELPTSVALHSAPNSARRLSIPSPGPRHVEHNQTPRGKLQEPAATVIDCGPELSSKNQDCQWTIRTERSWYQVLWAESLRASCRVHAQAVTLRAADVVSTNEKVFCSIL